MPGKPPRPLNSVSDSPPSGEDRFPSNAELLHELRLHGARPPKRELPRVSRRTRDFLLVAGVGSAAVGFVIFRLMASSDPMLTMRLALTVTALLCALLWFIFYGVMSRY